MKEVGSSPFPKHPQPMQRKGCVGICKQMAVPLGDLVYMKVFLEIALGSSRWAGWLAVCLRPRPTEPRGRDA